MDFLKRNPDKRYSVREIYEEISDSDISISAVYRNISALEAEGIINRFTKEGTREITYQYTHSDECRNCIHLTCTKCGKTFHMNSTEAENIVNSVKLTDGFEINRLKSVFYGSCKDCVREA